MDHPLIERVMRTGYPETEPEVVGECIGCGEEIYKGEDVYDYNGELLHQDSACCMEYISNASICKTA